jgi:hypothetical protein
MMYIVVIIGYLSEDSRTYVALFILIVTMIANFMIYIPYYGETDDYVSPVWETLN